MTTTLAYNLTSITTYANQLIQENGLPINVTEPNNVYDIAFTNKSGALLDLESFSNSTTDSDRPYWHVILDKVITYVMILNVINVMLGMGCAIYLKQVLRSLCPPVGILIGMVGQFIIIPAIGFGLCLLFDLRPYEALGCLVVSCSPGGTFSNFYTYWMEGDLALSIIMTSCSSIVAFIGMPLNLWLYSSYYVGEKANDIQVPYINILKSLAVIAVPVIIGMIIRHYNEKVATRIVKVSTRVAVLAIFIVMACWATVYWKVFLVATPYLYLCAMILPLSGFAAAYLVALLCCRSHKVCRTIGIETGTQNMPIAMSIILISFADLQMRSEMLLFPSIYAAFIGVEMLIMIILFKTYRFYTKKNKRLLAHQADIEEKGVIANSN